jgi:hypothetical protein
MSSQKKIENVFGMTRGYNSVTLRIQARKRVRFAEQSDAKEKLAKETVKQEMAADDGQHATAEGAPSVVRNNAMVDACIIHEPHTVQRMVNMANDYVTETTMSTLTDIGQQRAHALFRADPALANDMLYHALASRPSRTQQVEHHLRFVKDMMTNAHGAFQQLEMVDAAYAKMRATMATLTETQKAKLFDAILNTPGRVKRALERLDDEDLEDVMRVL